MAHEQNGTTIPFERARRPAVAAVLDGAARLAQRAVVHLEGAPADGSGDEERQLRTAVDAMTRGREMASAAHELRSPLAVVRGYLSTITEYHERLTAGEIVDLAARAQAAVMQLEELVDDLLLLSKLDAGALPRPVRSVSLGALVGAVVDGLRATDVARNFVFDSRARDTRVRGDREQLRAVVAKLLDNAIKFSPEATAIEIGVATPCDGAVSVTVRDYGPGVPAAELERIFSRFHRVRTAANATVPGAGLGLAICRALVEHHGGRIEASAPAGGGLAVTFTLPLAARRAKR